MILRIAVTSLLLLGLASCQPREGAPPVETADGGAGGPLAAPEGRGAPDTARGLLERIGNEPLASLVLRRGEAAGLALESAEMDLLVAVVGTEIVVAGQLTDRVDHTASPVGLPVFEVAWFEVRAVEGVPALDGALESDGSVWFLRTRDGVRHALRHVPPSLTSRAGARVFLAGPPDQAPAGYGVIQAGPPER